MLFQNVWQNLQCKMFLLSDFLTPLVWIHFSVGHVCIVVFIFLKHTQNGESQSKAAFTTCNCSNFHDPEQKLHYFLHTGCIHELFRSSKPMKGLNWNLQT